MIEIEMSKDIRDFAPKVFGPFTMRQVVCLLIGVLCATPAFIFVKTEFFTKLTIGVICAMPAIVCGWVDAFGYPMEQFVGLIIKSCFIYPRHRKYKYKTEYEKEDERIVLEDIRSAAKEKKKNPDKAVEKYLKQKTKPAKIKKSKQYIAYK